VIHQSVEERMKQRQDYRPINLPIQSELFDMPTPPEDS
jgi:hypothetical protein